MINQAKLHGLSLTAAVQICSHPEIAVILGGSEDRRNPIDMIAAIIEDILTSGLDYTPPAPAPQSLFTVGVLSGLEEVCWICHKPKGQPPDRCPGHYDTSTVGGAGLEPLPLWCVCGHLQVHHKASPSLIDLGRMKCYGHHNCKCTEFDSGYVNENPVDSQSPSS